MIDWSRSAVSVALCVVLFLHAALSPLVKSASAQDALWSTSSAICRTAPAIGDDAPAPAHTAMELHDLCCCLSSSRFDLSDSDFGWIPIVYAVGPAGPIHALRDLSATVPSASSIDVAARPARAPPAILG